MVLVIWLIIMENKMTCKLCIIFVPRRMHVPSFSIKLLFTSSIIFYTFHLFKLNKIIVNSVQLNISQI